MFETFNGPFLSFWQVFAKSRFVGSRYLQLARWNVGFQSAGSKGCMIKFQVTGIESHCFHVIPVSSVAESPPVTREVRGSIPRRGEIFGFELLDVQSFWFVLFLFLFPGSVCVRTACTDCSQVNSVGKVCKSFQSSVCPAIRMRVNDCRDPDWSVFRSRLGTVLVWFGKSV